MRPSSNNKKLYQILEIEPTATEEEIKKAYKKMALKYHPDKNPDAGEQFKEINNAHNILIDPQKRQIYDMYGEEGLALYDNGVFGGDGELARILPFLQNPVLLALFCLILVLTSAITFLIPMFIALKVDGDVDWNWGAVFSPLWIINIIPLIYYCCLPFITDGSRIGGCRQQFQYWTILIFQILLCINLEHENWKWTTVFIPIYIYLGFLLLNRFFSCRHSKFTQEVEEDRTGVLFGCGYLGFILRKIFVPLIFIWFIIFLVVKLDGVVTWNWWINSIPIYFLLAWKFLLRLADSNQSMKGVDGDEEKSRKRLVLISISILLIIVGAFALTFILLLFAYLDGAHYSLAIVFIPLFIVTGLLCCCCCCGAPCLICCRPPPDQFDSASETSPVGEFRKQKYIEASPLHEP